MDKQRKLKEAFKLALAFALVYGIALQINWMLPSWAGWSVVAIAASSSGQSIQKGVMRLLGTILACLSAITIIAISTQDRWVFVCLTAIWLFFTAYMMLADKSRSYFWFVVAYVCLVILVVGPSPVGAFAIAASRTMETAMGIVVYTLIGVFIWPRSNVGAIKKAAGNLMNTQVSLLQVTHELITGSVDKGKLPELRQQEIKQTAQLTQALKDEGSECYEVKEIRPLWDQFENLNLDLVKTKDRLFSGIDGLQKLHIPRLLPNLNDFFKEINCRFSETVSLLSGNQPSIKLKDVKATMNREAIVGISLLDKSALAIVITELNKLESVSRSIVSVVLDIAGFQGDVQKSAGSDIMYQHYSGFKLPIPEIENLKGALYVALVVFFGFIIWFYVNPPGHSMWFIMSGIFALIFAPVQPVNMAKLIFPLLLAMFLSSLIYVFILPELARFYQLGILLFTCMFLIRYFLSGVLSLVFTLVFIQMIAITNPQDYNVEGLINSFVYIPMIMMYLFIMSYIIHSPRPEKAFLRLVRRFLKSVGYLILKLADDSRKTPSFIERYKMAFHLQELQTLPARMNGWGKAIDKKLFMDTDPKKIEEMVNSLKVFVVRIDALMEVKSCSSQNKHLEMLSDAIADWKQELNKIFGNWDVADEELKTKNTEASKRRFFLLEDKIDRVIAQNRNSLNEEEGIQFYRFLGSFHAITEAALSFAKAADAIDWQQYKDERF